MKLSFNLSKKSKWLQSLGIIFLVVTITVILTARILAQPPQISHPLDPLTKTEFNTAVAVVKKEKN